MIRVCGLTKIYDDHLAVDGLDFELGPGKICGMVGPNGAGKTTTMRCLAGLIPATTGYLSISGFDVATETLAVKRCLAYVPDDPPLFDDLSVFQHLDFIGRIYGIDHHLAKSETLLQQFNLDAKRDAGATTLSRGMRQKLAICCAYLTDPKVLLLDEPLTGLDPPGIRTLMGSIAHRAAAGATIVISSHLLAMIEDVCSQILVMQLGKSMYFGDTDQLRQKHPETKSLEDAYFAATMAPTSLPGSSTHVFAPELSV